MSEERRGQYEAYVWRLAMLLTDDAVAAEWILNSILRSQPDLLRVGETRRDRMVVLRAREWARGDNNPRSRRERERAVRRSSQQAGQAPHERFSGEAKQLWVAARQLDRQRFEAWLLLDVVGTPEIDASRSLDCSKSAMLNHAQAAREALMPLFDGDLSAAAARLRVQIQEWDAGPALEVARERRRQILLRRRITLAIWIIVLLLIMGVLVWTAWDVMADTRPGETFRDRIPGDEDLNLVQPVESPE